MSEFSACVGCGYCCQKTVCLFGQVRGAYSEPPCKFLRKIDGIFRCELVLNSDYRRRSRVKHALAIGVGCSSSLNSQRTEHIRRMRKEDG